MKQVSVGLVGEVVSRVATIDWSQVDGDKLHRNFAALTPEAFKQKVTAFFNAEEKLLQPVGPATFVIDTMLNWRKVLQSEEGLWVDPDMKKIIDQVKEGDVMPTSVTLNRGQIKTSCPS